MVHVYSMQCLLHHGIHNVSYIRNQKWYVSVLVWVCVYVCGFSPSKHPQTPTPPPLWLRSTVSSHPGLGRSAQVWCQQPDGSWLIRPRALPFMGPDSRCRAYWLVLPLRRPSVFMCSHWPALWTSPTAPDYDDKARKEPGNKHNSRSEKSSQTHGGCQFFYVCVCVSVFISPT